MFTATLTYELHASTDAETRKLLRAELVGRRYKDRIDGMLLPASCVWIRRGAEAHETVDDIHRACGEDLEKAAAAVRAMGRTIEVVRAWVQVSGAGTYGLVKLAAAR
jgi:hypothetical protein